MVVQYLPNDIRVFSSFILIYEPMILGYMNPIYSQAIVLCKCLSTHQNNDNESSSSLMAICDVIAVIAGVGTEYPTSTEQFNILVNTFKLINCYVINLEKGAQDTGKNFVNSKRVTTIFLQIL